MEEMTRKQPDVDKITKTHKRKAAAEPPIQSQIPVLNKGRTGSMYPTNFLLPIRPRAIWPSAESLQGDATSLLYSVWHLGWNNFFFLVTLMSFTTGKRSPTQAMYASTTQTPIETKNPRVNLLVSKWQHVWLLALDRRRKLNDALDRLEEVNLSFSFIGCSGSCL